MTVSYPATGVPDSLDVETLQSVADWFNPHHDKLLCTASRTGEPTVALMGTPRLAADGTFDFEISDVVSVTLNNVKENPAVACIAYVPGPRARDYFGVRIYARVIEIATSGERFAAIYAGILARHGAVKASELQAVVRCRVTKVRPVVDRGQRWNEPSM